MSDKTDISISDSSRDYDFYVLGSLDSPLGESAAERLHGRFQNEDQIFDLSKVAPVIVSQYYLKKDNLTPAEKLKIEKDCKDSLDKLKGAQAGIIRAVDALLDGKVCVDYLISTLGGDIIHAIRTGNCFSFLQANGGIIRTYAMENAMSLGAVNWTLGDERYVTGYSQLMWHLPQPKDENSESLNPLEVQMIELVRLQMTEFFQSTEASVSWAEEIKQFKKKEKLILSGKELHEAGLATGIFKYSKDVKAHISKDTPWQFSRQDNDAFLGPQLWYELCS